VWDDILRFIDSDEIHEGMPKRFADVSGPRAGSPSADSYFWMPCLQPRRPETTLDAFSEVPASLPRTPIIPVAIEQIS